MGGEVYVVLGGLLGECVVFGECFYVFEFLLLCFGYVLLYVGCNLWEVVEFFGEGG